MTQADRHVPATGDADASVVTVLRRRREDGSRAGERRDPWRVALVIEGGGSRSAVSAGMALTLVREGLVDAFDAVYATSGGALNGAWLLSSTPDSGLRSWAYPDVLAARVIDPWRAARGGPLVDMRRLVEHVYAHVTPMDFDAILAHPTSFHPIATDAQTGDAVDLHPHLTDAEALRDGLRASGCLPWLAGPPVLLGGRSYLDGGLTHGVPARLAAQGGATHLLVLRTKRADDLTRAASRVERAVLRRYYRRHGAGAGAGRAHAVRHLAALEEERWLEQACAESDTVRQVRPGHRTPAVSRLSRDSDLIAKAIRAGAAAMAEALG
ncbi:patatin-like phospholipase family protein [Nocardioides faecalis]|uniref:patatin-like phospholipase family protein n=1 Tax=Nocardioides faecalis TaxID=2803858 RepID=UPI0020BD56D6|nr:patatin-like phospholipase family protein [Nocardioides faecalis]